MFILTTNNVNALEGALRSRCIEISFNPKHPKIWLPRLRSILATKNICANTFSDGFLSQMVSNANFDAREIMYQLQTAISNVNANNAMATLKTPPQVAASATVGNPQIANSLTP